MRKYQDFIQMGITSSRQSRRSSSEDTNNKRAEIIGFLKKQSKAEVDYTEITSLFSDCEELIPNDDIEARYKVPLPQSRKKHPFVSVA